ncbi:MAG: hypothetical protein AAF629_34875 [Chloroflexota bacterium]
MTKKRQTHQKSVPRHSRSNDAPLSADALPLADTPPEFHFYRNSNNSSANIRWRHKSLHGNSGFWFLVIMSVFVVASGDWKYIVAIVGSLLYWFLADSVNRVVLDITADQLTIKHSALFWFKSRNYSIGAIQRVKVSPSRYTSKAPNEDQHDLHLEMADGETKTLIKNLKSRVFANFVKGQIEETVENILVNTSITRVKKTQFHLERSRFKFLSRFVGLVCWPWLLWTPLCAVSGVVASGLIDTIIHNAIRWTFNNLALGIALTAMLGQSYLLNKRVRSSGQWAIVTGIALLMMSLGLVWWPSIHRFVQAAFEANLYFLRDLGLIEVIKPNIGFILPSRAQTEAEVYPDLSGILATYFLLTTFTSLWQQQWLKKWTQLAYWWVPLRLALFFTIALSLFIFRKDLWPYAILFCILAILLETVSGLLIALLLLRPRDRVLTQKIQTELKQTGLSIYKSLGYLKAPLLPELRYAYVQVLLKHATVTHPLFEPGPDHSKKLIDATEIEPHLSLDAGLQGRVLLKANTKAFNYWQSNGNDGLATVTQTLIQLGQKFKQIEMVGGRVAPALSAIANEPGESIPSILATALLSSIAQSTTRQLEARANSLICSTCLTHPVAHPVVIKTQQFQPYFGCGVCHQSHTFVQRQVIAVLDRTMIRDEVPTEVGAIRASWFTRQTLFDFSAVEILNTSDQDVEKFALMVKSDQRAKKQERYQQMPCTIDPNCPLTENTRRILCQTFATVTVKAVSTREH